VKEHVMRAVVVAIFDEPLRVKVVPLADPAARRILVRIEVSGLCYTDIHAAHGDWAEPKPPSILEREEVGTVIKVGGVMPGDKVAIFGIGGLGHLARQYAQIVGGVTIAVDVTDERLELARELGAAHVINAAVTDPVAAIEELGGADVAIVLAADPKVIEQAHASLRPGGQLILVSLPKDTTMALPVFRTVLKGIRVVGSIVGTRSATSLPAASPHVPTS
jgi:D-arabinose 1-dehydrogenase-like Zn-dependent alcohol dehydrogenase